MLVKIILSSFLFISKQMSNDGFDYQCFENLGTSEFYNLGFSKSLNYIPEKIEVNVDESVITYVNSHLQRKKRSGELFLQKSTGECNNRWKLGQLSNSDTTTDIKIRLTVGKHKGYLDYANLVLKGNHGFLEHDLHGVNDRVIIPVEITSTPTALKRGNIPEDFWKRVDVPNPSHVYCATLLRNGNGVLGSFELAPGSVIPYEYVGAKFEIKKSDGNMLKLRNLDDVAHIHACDNLAHDDQVVILNLHEGEEATIKLNGALGNEDLSITFGYDQTNKHAIVHSNWKNSGMSVVSQSADQLNLPLSPNKIPLFAIQTLNYRCIINRNVGTIWEYQTGGRVLRRATWYVRSIPNDVNIQEHVKMDEAAIRTCEENVYSINNH